jgi:hypothetical protein
LQQPHAESLLQLGNAAADARLWNAQRAGGAGKAAVRYHGGEKGQVVEVFHDSPVIVSSVEQTDLF